MRIACVQSNVVFNDPAANAKNLIQKLSDLKNQGVDFALFPEAYLTGYCVDGEVAAKEIAIPVKGEGNLITKMPEYMTEIQAKCEELGMGCVFGFAGQDAEGLYNAVALFEPGQPARWYLKVHLPYLGYDRYTRSGKELPVFETQWGKIGVLICFDQRPPEAARVLALKGADIILLPTNWPVGAEVSAEYMTIARASENRVFVATCNRVGVENGTKFIGLSKIVNISGKVLAAAGPEEEIIIADLDLPQARQKRIVNIPGEYEMEVFASRHPELYEVISTP